MGWFDNSNLFLTDTGENVQKWTRVFSTPRWVVLVARTRRKKKKKIACPLLDVFACGQVSSPRLYRLRIKYFFGTAFHLIANLSLKWLLKDFLQNIHKWGLEELCMEINVKIYQKTHRLSSWPNVAFSIIKVWNRLNGKMTDR